MGTCPSCGKNWVASGAKVLPNKQLRDAVTKAQEAAEEAGVPWEMAVANMLNAARGGAPMAMNQAAAGMRGRATRRLG